MPKRGSNMEKRRTVFIILLSFIILASAYFSISVLIQLNIENYLQYIPIIIFIISLAFLISIAINIKNARASFTLQNRLKMWNSITYKVKKAGETAFNKLPIGIIVVDSDSKIVWSNQNARTIFMSPLEHIYLKELSSSLYAQLEENLKEVPRENIEEDKKITFNTDIYGKIYYIEYLVKYNVMYLTDITNYELLQN